MKKRNIIFYAVWLLALVILQPTVVQWIDIFGVSPDLFLIFVVCVGLFRDKTEGAVCGLIFGLVFDLLVGRMIGLSALMYMYVGLLMGIIKERFVSDGAVVGVAAVFVAALLCGVIYYIGYFIAWGDLGFGRALIRTILPKALYTAVTAFILFVPIRKSFDLTDRKTII